jgi:hypothetical protein
MNLPIRKQNNLAISLVVASSLLTALLAVADPATNAVPAKPAQAAEEIINNASIVELKQLGLGESVILEKIKTTRTDFDVSLNGLKQLKQAGLSDALIAAMVSAKTPTAAEKPVADASAAHAAGIWLEEEIDGKAKQSKLEPSPSTTKTGMMVFAGFGQPVKTQAVVQGLQAGIQVTNRRPVFYFYFNKNEAGLGNAQQSASSPKEFVLAKFDVNEKDKQRSMVVGEFNVYRDNRSGADSKSIRDFSSEEVTPGVYKVSPKEDLANGEYCFYNGGNASGVVLLGGGVSAGKVYDFGVKGSPETEPKPLVAEVKKEQPKKKSLFQRK